MVAHASKALGQRAWLAFHRLRITVLPPLVRHLNEQCGMTEAEYQVLFGLHAAAGGQMRPSDLAKELGWDVARLSHQVSRMESKGLLTRQQCPVDARSCWLGASKQGEALIAKALPLQMREVHRLFSAALTAEQLRSLIEISEAVEAHVNSVRTS